jgi:hypothetical protein
LLFFPSSDEAAEISADKTFLKMIFCEDEENDDGDEYLPSDSEGNCTSDSECEVSMRLNATTVCSHSFINFCISIAS